MSPPSCAHGQIAIDTQQELARFRDIRHPNAQTVLLPQHFAKVAASNLVNPLEEQIRNASEREAEVLEGLRTLKSKGLQRLASGLPEWEEDNGLVYHKGRVYSDLQNRKNVTSITLEHVIHHGQRHHATCCTYIMYSSILAF